MIPLMELVSEITSMLLTWRKDTQLLLQLNISLVDITHSILEPVTAHLFFNLLKLTKKQVEKTFRTKLWEEDQAMQEHHWLIPLKPTSSLTGKQNMESKKCAKTLGTGRAEIQEDMKIQKSQIPLDKLKYI